MKSFRSKLARGAIWILLARFLSRALGVASIAILARLLTPEDFGLIAAAWTVVMFVMLIAEFDFDAVIVQKQEVTRGDYDTVFTLKAMIGLIVSAMGIAASDLMARFFEEPKLQAVIAALCLVPLCRGFHNPRLIQYRRELNFTREFLIDVVPKIVGAMATILAAIIFASYWSLVFGTISASAMGLALSYFIHPFRPNISFHNIVEYFNFSKWVFLNSSLHYLYTRFADLLIGKLSGLAELGVFRIGNQVASLTTTELAEPLNRVLFPGYSRIARDSQRLKRVYLQSFSIIGYVGIPAAVGVLACAQPLVLVLLGEKWTDAIPIIEILALHGALHMLSITDYAIYMGIGRPKVILALYLPYVVALICIMILLTPVYGIVGSAWAFVVADILLLPIFFATRFRILSLTLGEYFPVIWRSVVGAVLMFVVLRWLIDKSSILLESNLLILLMSIVSGVVTYLILTFGSWFFCRTHLAAEKMISDFIMARFRA